MKNKKISKIVVYYDDGTYEEISHPLPSESIPPYQAPAYPAPVIPTYPICPAPTIPEWQKWSPSYPNITWLDNTTNYIR